jgi:hypothetical protein
VASSSAACSATNGARTSGFGIGFTAGSDDDGINNPPKPPIGSAGHSIKPASRSRISWTSDRGLAAGAGGGGGRAIRSLNGISSPHLLPVRGEPRWRRSSSPGLLATGGSRFIPAAEAASFPTIGQTKSGGGLLRPQSLFHRSPQPIRNRSIIGLGKGLDLSVRIRRQVEPDSIVALFLGY